MNQIQKSKQKLESDIKKLIEDFHKENKGYEVYRVNLLSKYVTTHAPKETYQEITNTKLSTDIQVL
jgi:hypothetical protein